METAAQVAAWVNHARASQRESLQYLLLAGQALRDQKASLPKANWLLWLKDNQEALGFGIRTAQRLMAAALKYANTTLASHGDEEVSALCAQIWGHEAELEPNEAPKVFRTIERLLAFTRKHTPSELLSIQERTQLTAYLAQLRLWLTEAESVFREVA